MVNKDEELQKMKVSRYMDMKVKETIQVKSADANEILSMALQR